jgi:hypothetical protein
MVARDPELARAIVTAHIANGERWLREQLAAGNEPDDRS